MWVKETALIFLLLSLHATIEKMLFLSLFLCYNKFISALNMVLALFIAMLIQIQKIKISILLQ
jgi:hypothetical protein